MKSIEELIQANREVGVRPALETAETEDGHGAGAPIAIRDLARSPPAILVVNDRESQRVAIRAILAPLGVLVVEAASGRAALRAVLRRPFASILMDVRMPTMDGYETAKLIRQRKQTSRTPIIFITAHAPEDEDCLHAYASGAVDFISTPVVATVLRAKVSVFVDLFQQSEELHRRSEELRHSLASIRALNAALRDREASTQAVLDNVADGILTIGETGLIESFDRSAQALFGYREEEVVGRPLPIVIAPTHRDDLRELASTPPLATQRDARSETIETIGRRQNGSTFVMELEHGGLTLGNRRMTFVFVRDITARKAYTSDLEHQTLHDRLTGLANRTLFGIQVAQAIASAKRDNASRAVLIMDLDAFKRVNDRLGHERGDILLTQVRDRLVAAMRETDVIARLGGDEFAILPGDATDLAGAAAVAWKIEQACEEGFVIDDEIIHVSASIGIALFPAHGATADELLGRADVAMYVAKRSGSGHAVFDAAQEKKTADQLALLVDLRECISRDQLVLHYQPKINLLTREISGVEALVRWCHPVHGLLAPARFMPDVESTELIAPVTRWVLNEALRQQRIWLNQGIDLTMAVNISARSLRPGSELADTVAELTEVHGTTPDRLILELTEGALIEAGAPDILARLHDMGEQLSIDDFGTGYSSLAYLQRLPVNELKVDKSFITSVAVGNSDALIVRSTIELAHNLGMTVVAEGVEDERVITLLAEANCDAAQGYFFGRPCAADELTNWLTDSPYGNARDRGAMNHSAASPGPDLFGRTPAEACGEGGRGGTGRGD